MHKIRHFITLHICQECHAFQGNAPHIPFWRSMLQGKQYHVFILFQILVSTASLFAVCEALAAQVGSARICFIVVCLTGLYEMDKVVLPPPKLWDYCFSQHFNYQVWFGTVSWETYPPGNDHISHLRKRKIIDSKVPDGGGYVSSLEGTDMQCVPWSHQALVGHAHNHEVGNCWNGAVEIMRLVMRCNKYDAYIS